MPEDAATGIVSPGDLLGDELRVTSVLPRARSGRGSDYAGRPARLSGAVHLSAVNDEGETVLLHYRDPRAMNAHTVEVPQVSADLEDWRPCYCVAEANEERAAA